MTSRSSRSIFSDPPCPVARAARWLRGAGLCLLVGVVTGLHAEPPPGSHSAPRPKAYVRFWNMLVGPGSSNLELIAAEGQMVTVAAAGDAFAGYVPVEPASYNFTVRKPGDPNAVIKRVPVVLRADVYITLLAAIKGGQPDVQMIDDTVDPKADNGLGKLVVRQFFPGASVTVGVNGPPGGTPLVFGESTVLDGLPIRNNTPVNMQATGLPGGVKNWSVELDLTSGHHATMMVIADPYGRFRPRLVFDGASRKPVMPADNSGRPAGNAPSPAASPKQ